jgi:hypothetical protein
MIRLLLLALGVAAAAGASSTAQAKPKDDDDPTPSEPSKASGRILIESATPNKMTAGARIQELENISPGRDFDAVRGTAERLARMLGWSDRDARWFGRFAMVQAHSESRGNYAAANASSSERAAARRAYNGQAEVYGSRWEPIRQSAPASAFYEEFGSGGWYGLIPSFGLHAFTGDADVGDVHPYDVFDPWRSTIMMLAFAERLTNRREWSNLSSNDRNAYALKRGFAAGALVDNLPDDDDGTDRDNVTNANVDRAIRELGLPSDWALERVPAALLRAPESWLAVVRQGELEGELGAWVPGTYEGAMYLGQRGHVYAWALAQRPTGPWTWSVDRWPAHPNGCDVELAEWAYRNAEDQGWSRAELLAALVDACPTVDQSELEAAIDRRAPELQDAGDADTRNDAVNAVRETVERFETIG